MRRLVLCLDGSWNTEKSFTNVWRIYVALKRNATQLVYYDQGVADVSIGELLSNAPAGDDGVWPCEPAREVIEDIQSVDMARGMHTGRYDARGVHWRGEGGGQERTLADEYRTWAEALQNSHPFVSSKLLMGLVKTYEAEAERADTEATIQRRLR